MLAGAVPTSPALPPQHTPSCTVTVLFVRITNQLTPILHALTLSFLYNAHGLVATIPRATTYLYLPRA